MKNIMLDLETLGTAPGSVILQIGAVAFDETSLTPDLLGERFDMKIYTPTCLAAGLKKDAATEAWWATKPIGEQDLLRRCNSTITSHILIVVLAMFESYVRRNGGDEALVWGNGSDFDNVLLSDAYRAAGEKTPWKFRNSRCYRTLKGLRPDIELVRHGQHHDGLDDAISQACHAAAIMGALGIGKAS